MTVTPRKFFAGHWRPVPCHHPEHIAPDPLQLVPKNCPAVPGLFLFSLPSLHRCHTPPPGRFYFPGHTLIYPWPFWTPWRPFPAAGFLSLPHFRKNQPLFFRICRNAPPAKWFLRAATFRMNAQRIHDGNAQEVFCWPLAADPLPSSGTHCPGSPAAGYRSNK